MSIKCPSENVMGKRTLVDLEVDGKAGFRSRNGRVGYPSISKVV
jgi:hypothetical protein